MLEESKAPELRHIASSDENVPSATLEIDGMHQQHPIKGGHSRCQLMLDGGSRAPLVIAIEETREWTTRNNDATVCKESLSKDWIFAWISMDVTWPCLDCRSPCGTMGQRRRTKSQHSRQNGETSEGDVPGTGML